MIRPLLSAGSSIPQVPMDFQNTQRWVEQNLIELACMNPTDVGGNAEKFQAAIDAFEKTGKKTPPLAALFHEYLTRYAPDDMNFSFPTITMVMLFADRPATVQMYAWSLVIETLKQGHVITLRDIRNTFGPLGIPSEEALSTLWKEQKIPRDPVSRSDNWLDRAEAWTLEGLARKTADA